MTDELFERYKAALREGHLAALKGELELARGAYERAAAIAPDRSLPLASLASVLRRLGRDADALGAYERALERVPGDVDALGGRAACLSALGRPDAAAEAYEALAEAHRIEGRLDDAIAAGDRAVALADTPARRDLVVALAAQRDERMAAEADGQARMAQDRAAAQELGAPDVARAVVEESGRGSGTGDEEAAAEEVAAAERAIPALALPLRATSTSDREPVGPRLSDDAARTLDDRITAAEARRDAGDAPGAVAAYREAAAGLRDAGRWRSALGACADALSLAPADGRLHLDLAELYLDAGWPTLAAAKIRLVAALADLDGDEDTAARAAMLVRDRLPDEPSLAALRA